MAVPKKKRTTGKLLNWGFKNRQVYSRMVNVSLTGLPSQYLTRLNPIKPTRLPKGGLQCTIGVGRLSKNTLRFLEGEKPIRIRGALDRDTNTFSQLYLKREFSRKFPDGHFIERKAINASLVYFLIWFLTIPLSQRRPFALCSKPCGLLMPVLSSVSSLPPYTNLLIKKSFFIARLPHRWGSQRNLFLKKWELAPAYYSLSYHLEGIDPSLIGSIRLGHPKNLITPKGPSLKNLWSFIKTNPNDGYWAYCMWLEVKKKWKRWLRFPTQYIFIRNIVRRFLTFKMYRETRYYFSYKSLHLDTEVWTMLRRYKDSQLKRDITYIGPDFFKRFAMLLKGSSFLEKEKKKLLKNAGSGFNVKKPLSLFFKRLKRKHLTKAQYAFMSIKSAKTFFKVLKNIRGGERLRSGLFYSKIFLKLRNMWKRFL